MSPRLLILIVLAIPHLSCAATSTWEAFDYKNCHHWEFTDDFGGYGPSYEKAVQLMDEMTTAEGRNGIVVQGWKMFEEAEMQYGVCKGGIVETMTCKSATEFPLADATFVEVKPMTFRCTKGCEKVPFTMLYGKGYEDGPDSSDWAPAARKFESQCHEERRYKNYYKRLDKKR